MPAIAPIRQDLSRPSLPLFWFKFGIAAVFLVSLMLRFWGLTRFNTLVFDEVYYARFAAHFLKGELIFTGHPPLSTYLIAIGIWLGNQMPWDIPWNAEGLRNTMSGLLLSPWSYRWLNALTGSLIPLVVGAIAYQLSHRRSYTLIAAGFVAMDGLFLVESRYALNNVYLILFGLLGNLLLLLSLKHRLNSPAWQHWGYLSLAGACFGASASIKWNGLGFLFGAFLLWSIATLLYRVPGLRSRCLPLDQSFPLSQLPQLHPVQLLLCLICVPALVYYLSWLPYMQVDRVHNFWELQYLTWDYHRRVGGIEAHPYCSPWFTWPLMIRPIAYFYQVVPANQAMPAMGLPLASPSQETIYDVHAMGNPVLYWFSTAAVLLLIGLILTGLWHRSESRFGIRGWIALYLLTNWLANLLPWVMVKRCVFLYHYMASSVFALLAIALLVDYEFRRRDRSHQISGWIVVTLIGLGFIFWMPLYLGLPLSPAELTVRRWLPTWI